MGVFWDAVKKDFPNVQELPPLAPIIEGPSPAFQPTSINVQLLTAPPAPRVWLMSPTGANLIQIQHDRFLFNWKKTSDEETYPRYNNVFARFENYFRIYQEILASQDALPLTFRQFELAYVNIIGPKNGLAVVGEGGLLVDHLRQNSSDRFLPNPELLNISASYSLPSNFGRLHLTAAPAVLANERVVRLDLTARGIPAERIEEHRSAWFDLAHDWIVHGFADCTNSRLHASDIWDRNE